MRNMYPLIGGAVMFALLLSITSCDFLGLTTTSKDEYMDEYQNFIVATQDNYRKYNHKEWESADKKMESFSHDLYLKYKAELSFRDKLELGKYPIMYYIARYKSMLDHEINDNYRQDTKAIVQNLAEIMDSTAHVYDVFDEEIRGMLRDFGSKNTRAEENYQYRRGKSSTHHHEGKENKEHETNEPPKETYRVGN